MPVSTSAALNASFNICCAQCQFQHLLRSMPVSTSAALNASFNICCAQYHFHHLLRSMPVLSSAALNASFIICCAQCQFHHLLRSMPFSSSNTSASQFLCTHPFTSTDALKLRLSKKACFHGTVTNRCVHIDHSPVKLHATVLPATSDSDDMFCLQSYQGSVIDKSLVY